MIENKLLDYEKQKSFPITWQWLAKIVVSFLLIAWILSKAPLSSLAGILLECHWPGLLLAFVMVNLCMLISVFKWEPLLRVYEIRISFARLLGFYYAGLFANNFLPSSIGGDALRIYNVAKLSGKTKEAAASVVMERLVASLALGLTALMAMVFMSQQSNNGLVYRSVGGLVVLCTGLTVFLFCYPFREESKIGRWLCRLGSYKKHPVTLARVLGLSFLFQVCLVFSNVFIFQSVGVNLSLSLHFLYVPVVMAVSMIPLSINGLGVREGMYVVLYGYAGVEPATAMLCSLLFYSLVTLASLAGGVVIFTRK